MATGILLLGLALPGEPAATRASVPDLVQDVWQAGERSLPHPGVTAFQQTRDGYLWIGTYSGATRFDGVQFERPRLSGVGALSDHIKAITETGDGAVWFASRREGVARLKDGTARAFTVKEGLASNDVRGFAALADGTVWIATAAGVNVVDAGTDRVRTYTMKDGLPTNFVVSLFRDRDGSMWVGTTEFGLARFDGTKFESRRLEVPASALNVTPLMGMASQSVTSIVRDGDGVLWAGTSVGLVRVDEDGRMLFHDVGSVSSVVPAKEGGVWVGSGGGITRIQKGEVSRFTARDGLLHDMVLSAFEDADGSVWVGTRVGMARLRPRIIHTYTSRDGLANDLVMAVLETRDGDIWAGTRGGLSRLHDGTWTTYGVKDGLPQAGVRSLAQTPDGTLWVGTLDGVARLENGRFTRQATEGAPYAVRSMVVDPQGRLWLGVSDLGVDRLEGGTIRRIVGRKELCGSNPNTLFAAADGSIWVGGSTALVHIRDDKARCFSNGDLLSRNDVRAIDADEDGSLWVGSIGGLTKFTGTVGRTYAGEYGPFNTAIYGLIDDGRGSLWCSTPKGLFQISKKDIERFDDPSAAVGVYRSFGTADGMETPVGVGDGQPGAFRAKDGRLYFTTAGGIAVVDPSRIQLSAAPPRVYIEKLRADHQLIDLSKDLRLAPGTRDVQFGFTALSFIAPERVQFKYKLEGYDREWRLGGDRRDASYTNLPPSRYRFRVIAANHNGVWNEQGAALEFQILPRFYQRGWFLPLCVAALVAVAAAAYRLRIARLRASEIELQRRVEEEVAKVRQLSGMLPICASCRRVREDTGYWRQIEAYVMEHSSAKFSHGVCPECWDKMRHEDPDLPEYGRN